MSLDEDRTRHGAIHLFGVIPAPYRGPPFGCYSDPDLHQVAARAPKDVEIARVRVALQRLLHLEGETVHAAPHVGVSHRQPHPDRRRDRGQRRTAAMTRRNATSPISAPTRMQVPSGKAISIRLASMLGAAIRERSCDACRGEAAPDAGPASSICIGTNINAGSATNAPRADLLPPGYVGHAGTWRLSLRHHPQLVRDPPSTTTLNPGDDLHPANHP